jgi:hypothetical protein
VSPPDSGAVITLSEVSAGVLISYVWSECQPAMPRSKLIQSCGFVPSFQTTVHAVSPCLVARVEARLTVDTLQRRVLGNAGSRVDVQRPVILGNVDHVVDARLLVVEDDDTALRSKKSAVP